MIKNNLMNEHWILVNNKLKKVDMMTWAKWFENVKSPGRITKQTMIGKVMVSTVFLGLDHSFGEGKKPVLWETMIFKSNLNGLKDYQVRYSSLKDAEKGHKYAVDFATRMLKK